MTAKDRTDARPDSAETPESSFDELEIEERAELSAEDGANPEHSSESDPETDSETNPEGGDATITIDAGEVARTLREMTDADLLALEQRAGERDVYRDELLRSRADLDNLQKRIRRERPQWEDQAVRRFVADLLPVIDNFERALSTAPAGAAGPLEQGVRLIHQMMLKVLSDHGVEEIAAAGQLFDPEVHEAVAVEEVQEGPDNEILEVQQRGYRYKGTVVRPSLVKVAKRVESARREGSPNTER